METLAVTTNGTRERAELYAGLRLFVSTTGGRELGSQLGRMKDDEETACLQGEMIIISRQH